MNTPASKTPLRCVFFGSDDFARTTLEHLLSRPDLCTVVAVVSRPGKQPIIAATPSHATLLQPERLDAAFLDVYQSLEPAIAIVASYGAIIGQRILDVPPLGTWNVHPSLLPIYRGPTPVETAVRDGITETGVSIMLLDAQMDHGPIFARAPYTIESNAYAPVVRDALATLGATTLLQTLERYIRNPFEPEPQHHAAATYTTKITTENTALDIQHWPLTTLAATIRAYPGQSWFTLPSGHRVIVYAATLHPNPIPSNTRQLQATKRAINLVDGDQLLTFDEVQVAGGRRMDAQQFVNGYRSHVVPSTHN